MGGFGVVQAALLYFYDAFVDDAVLWFLEWVGLLIGRVVLWKVGVLDGTLPH